MKHYLLDTHILLWWLSDDIQLEKRARDIISRPTNHIIVSTVSVWEIVIKKSLGKLKVPDNIQEIIHENAFEILPIYVDHVLQLEHVPAIHNDPFDRLLIAQSIVEDLTFITADTTIMKYNIDCYNR